MQTNSERPAFAVHPLAAVATLVLVGVLVGSSLAGERGLANRELGERPAPRQMAPVMARVVRAMESPDRERPAAGHVRLVSSGCEPVHRLGQHAQAGAPALACPRSPCTLPLPPPAA